MDGVDGVGNGTLAGSTCIGDGCRATSVGTGAGTGGSAGAVARSLSPTLRDVLPLNGFNDALQPGGYGTILDW